MLEGKKYYVSSGGAEGPNQCPAQVTAQQEQSRAAAALSDREAITAMILLMTRPLPNKVLRNGSADHRVFVYYRRWAGGRWPPPPPSPPSLRTPPRKTRACRFERSCPPKKFSGFAWRRRRRVVCWSRGRGGAPCEAFTINVEARCLCPRGGRTRVLVYSLESQRVARCHRSRQLL